jgi:predicted MFS family arabinose efflux permease
MKPTLQPPSGPDRSAGPAAGPSADPSAGLPADPTPASPSSAGPARFTRYQIFVIALVAFLQFTVILDFMILSPLGAILLEKLSITTEQFGHVVSAYAFSAGASGLLAAGFADRFDRKKMLLFFYTGFLVGTLLCGLATSYGFLLGARIFTGIFGGVMGSIAMAIVTDIFAPSMRGRVMGFVQSAFAASQILGLPFGIYLATKMSWHAPFIMIVILGAFAGVAIAIWLRPIDDHLKTGAPRRNPFAHLAKTAARPEYMVGFSATILLATGGFMLMPFGTTFLVNNIHIGMDQLPTIYLVTGFSSMVFGPLLGRAADSLGKYRVFVGGSLVTIAMVVYYTRLGVAPLWWVIVLNVALFAGITARMVSSFAMTSTLPEMTDRGAYMSIASSLQQLAGGVAAFVAGLIVHQTAEGPLENYPTLGLCVAATTVVTMLLMFKVDGVVKKLTAERAESAAASVRLA